MPDQPSPDAEKPDAAQSMSASERESYLAQISSEVTQVHPEVSDPRTRPEATPTIGLAGNQTLLDTNLHEAETISLAGATTDKNDPGEQRRSICRPWMPRTPRSS